MFILGTKKDPVKFKASNVRGIPERRSYLPTDANELLAGSIVDCWCPFIENWILATVKEVTAKGTVVIK